MKMTKSLRKKGLLYIAMDEFTCNTQSRTNIQNDKLLHKLVHTQLLSGSLNAELSLTPAQRRKALEGRILELAAGAKLGKGESIVKQEERKKASKKVRTGLERKVEERRSKALEEVRGCFGLFRTVRLKGGTFAGKRLGELPSYS